jgi:exonuclease SbcC
VAVAVARLAEAEQARDNSLGRAVEAAKIVDEAERTLELGRHADMAATLRAGLEVDGDCPVCDQPVHELPVEIGETHIEELGKVVGAARHTRTKVDQAREVALGALERAKEQLQAARDKKASVEIQLRGARKEAIRVRGDLEETTIRLEKILGSGDPEDQLKSRRQTYDAVLAERVEAQRQTDQVRALHDQAIRDEQEAGKALQDLGVRLAELATRLDVELTIGDDARSLGAAFKQLRHSWKEATAALGRDRQAAEEDLSRTEAEQEELLSDLEIETNFSSTVAVLDDRIARIELSVKQDVEELDQATGLYAEKESAADKVELFGRINSDLTDSRFVRFLLDEERSRLAELGSEHFQQLSGGRYRFADDQFAIVDLTAADSTRRADSLSGGETFLASLGLALGLAEMVAGMGGRLDAFFLDEGFGTLDPEHLDLAMEGIERLVADNSNRLVVVVSHVPELRMRLEDLIELERNPLTGDTRVIRA